VTKLLFVLLAAVVVGVIWLVRELAAGHFPYSD